MRFPGKADGLPDRGAAPRVIAGQISLEAGYLRDPRILAQHGSRNGVNLPFLAAEAVLLAVMTSENLDAGRATQHQLAAMIDRLPDANPLKPAFRQIEALTAYATTFRYVTPAGRIKDVPDTARLTHWQAITADIIDRCSKHFGIDLQDPAHPTALRSGPLRSPDIP